MDRDFRGRVLSGPTRRQQTVRLECASPQIQAGPIDPDARGLSVSSDIQPFLARRWRSGLTKLGPRQNDQRRQPTARTDSNCLAPAPTSTVPGRVQFSLAARVQKSVTIIEMGKPKAIRFVLPATSAPSGVRDASARFRPPPPSSDRIVVVH